jgi:hypothetical protein
LAEFVRNYNPCTAAERNHSVDLRQEASAAAAAATAPALRAPFYHNHSLRRRYTKENRRDPCYQCGEFEEDAHFATTSEDDKKASSVADAAAAAAPNKPTPQPSSNHQQRKGITRRSSARNQQQRPAEQ